MTQPLTPEHLAEIRKREQAATKGPWGTYYDGQGTYTVQSGCRVSLATGFTSDGDIATLHGEPGDGQTYANADFTARAREDVRDLLAENDRLRRELDRRTEDVAFLERTTLPELRREIQHHQDGKQRWRTRAEKAEAERDELKKWHENYAKGTKFAGREIRKRLEAAETERDELKKHLDR